MKDSKGTKTQIEKETNERYVTNYVDLYFNDDDVYMLHTCNVASVVKMWLFSR